VAGTSFEDGESLGLTVGGEPLHTRHLEPIGPGPGLSDVDVDGDALRGSSSLSFEVAADLLDTFSAEVVDLSSGLPVPVGSSSTQHLKLPGQAPPTMTLPGPSVPVHPTLFHFKLGRGKIPGPSTLRRGTNQAPLAGAWLSQCASCQCHLASQYPPAVRVPPPT
jgi:hypothetical protein